MAAAVWRGAEHPVLGTEAPMYGGPAYMNPQAGYWASSSAGPMAWQQGAAYDPTASQGSKAGPAASQAARFSASAHAAAAAQAAAHAQQAALRAGPGGSAGAPPGYFGGPARPPGALGVPSAAPAAQRSSRFTGQFMPHRLCNHFTGTGFCKKADQCTFAHGAHELHPNAAQQLGYSGAMDMRAAAQAQTVQMQQTQADNAVLSNGIEGFKFNTEAAPFAFSQFNADAAPFQPQSIEAEASAALEALAPEPVEPASAPAEAQTSPASSLPMSLPGVARRQAPAPLTQICETPKAGTLTGPLLGSPTASMASALPTPSAAAAATASTFGLASVAASPKAAQSPTAKVIRVGQPTPLMSPKALMSPTNGLRVTASLPIAAFETPTSPKVLRSPTASLAAVGPATVLGSPLNRVTTPTPTNASWDRNFLLQARAVAKKLEAGPPGLATYAPTPTSAARNFGFAYPQPGYVRTIPAPSKASAKSHKKKANVS